MSSNQFADNIGIYFGIIGSNDTLKIDVIDEILMKQDHPFFNADQESNPFQQKIPTGNVVNEILFKFLCPAEMMDAISAILYRTGWLHLTEDVPPMQGHFYEVKWFVESQMQMRCELYFTGSYQYIQDQAETAIKVERKTKRKKVKRQRRNIKRKLTFH